MRTLNRPMFNMGGPIKEGVMHGIREPHAGGQLVRPGPGRPGYAGEETFWSKFAAQYNPKNFASPKKFLQRINPFKKLKTVTKVPKITKNTWGILQKKLKPTGGVTGTEAATGWMAGPAKYWNKIRGAGPAYTGAWKKHPWKMTAGHVYGAPYAIEGGKHLPWGKIGQGLDPRPGWKKVFGIEDKETETVSDVPLNPNLQKTIAETESPVDKLLAGAGKENKEFALAERNKRVQKYLDLMGYKSAKKTAIADALIDASKIVGDRGTLDLKNIGQELINPIIQATSKRLDKPGQIREAVGLMMTKAGLEKEMYDAKPGTILKNVQDMIKSGIPSDEAWAIATKGSKGVVQDIQGAIATGKVGAGDWTAFVRSTGAEHGEEVSVITTEKLKETYGDDIKKHPSGMEIITEREKTEVVPDGIYQIGDDTIRIKNGKKTQLR